MGVIINCMVFAKKKKKLSRAYWKGTLYYRSMSKTWRDKPTGQIFYGTKRSIGRPIQGEVEVTNKNFYSRDRYKKIGKMVEHR